MKAPRTYRAERLKELAYLARFLGPVEFVRQVATRYQIEAAYSERRNPHDRKAQPRTPMFQGVPRSPVALPAPTQEPVACSLEDQSRELMDLVARQATTISKLEAELADARQILFLAHEALVQRNSPGVTAPNPQAEGVGAACQSGKAIS